jgi:hypothetical protein
MNEAFEKWWRLNYGMWNLSTPESKDLAKRAWEEGYEKALANEFERNPTHDE